MSSRNRSTLAAAVATLATSAQTIINGQVTVIPVPGGLKPAHGTSYDGHTKVESLKVGKSSTPGKIVMTNADDVGFEGTPHEFFVAAKQIADADGYDLIAKKRT